MFRWVTGEILPTGIREEPIKPTISLKALLAEICNDTIAIVSFDTKEGFGHFSPLIGVRDNSLVLPLTDDQFMTKRSFIKVGTHLRSADSTFLLRDQVFQIDIIQLNLLHELWDEKPYIDNEVKMLCTKIALCSLRSGAHNCECDGTRNVFAQTARRLRCDNDKEQIDRLLNCGNRNTFDLCIVLEYISTKHSNEHKD